MQLTTPPPPIDNFGLEPQWEGSGRESLTRFIPLQLKLTGSADLSRCFVFLQKLMLFDHFRPWEAVCEHLHTCAVLTV